MEKRRCKLELLVANSVKVTVSWRTKDQIVYEFAQRPAVKYADVPCIAEPASVVFIAGRVYHWHYESDLLKWATLLDLPALLLGTVSAHLLSPLGFCAFTLSWIEAFLILTFASFQWLLVGFIIESIVRALRE